MLTDRVKKAVRKIALMGCFALAFSCAVQGALPTKEECKAARAKLAELTSDDYKALKAKTKTNEEIGDALLGYVSGDDKSAVKFLLYQEAYEQYILGMVFEKADGVYGAAQTEEGTEYAQAIVAPMVTKLSGLATGKRLAAKALKTRIANDAQTLRRVMAAKKVLGKDPGNEELCERLALAYIEIGDWNSALASCMTISGELGKIAEWELSKTKNADFSADKVATFWWDYAGRYARQKRIACQIKLHAATWYRTAISEGLFKGVDEKLAEKRIDEAQEIVENEEKEGRSVASGKKAVKLPGLVVHFGFDGNLKEDVGKVEWTADEKVKWCSDHRKRPMSAIEMEGDTVLRCEKNVTEVEKKMTIAMWIKPEGKIDQFVKQQGDGKGAGSVRGPSAIVAVNFYNNGSHAEQGILAGENGVMLIEHGGNHLPAPLVYNKVIGKKWTHLVVAIQEGKKPVLYLNGKCVAEGAISPRIPIIKFGNEQNQNGEGKKSILGDRVNAMLPFVGAIADLSVYNRVLTTEEIMLLYME